MTLKTKLTLVSVLLIVITVAVAGFLGYRESKWKLKDLAQQLLVSKTDQAFILCEHHYVSSPEPSKELLREIADIKIADDGYITVLSNEDGPNKGRLIIHPTGANASLYNDDFPHMRDVIDDIDKNGAAHGYSGIKQYEQHTTAKGLQGEKKIGYYKYFAPWKWVLFASSYEKDVFSSRDQLRSTLFQIVIWVMILGVIVVFFLIGKMFEPVRRLTESTQEVAKGNWDISIDSYSNDEIGELSQAFNKMVRSIRENARMWHEFNVARDMQAEMLPTNPPRVPGIEIGAKSIPTKEVGGDFYDFLLLKRDKIGLVVGDVSGHGVSAAMVMTAALGAVRFAAEEKSRTDQALNMVNARLNKDIQSHMFVALFYGIYDPRKRTLKYTNAGQTMPYLVRNGRIEFLPQAEKSDRFPLGIVPATLYEQLTIELEPGDRLVLYTDGIVDAMNGSSEAYGFDRFADSIKDNLNIGPKQMIDKLVAGMNQYSNHNVHDDVTLVILEVI